MSNTATPDTPPKAEKNPQTTYIVMQKDGDGWLVQMPFESARSADEAIRKSLARQHVAEQEGTFVAIPARSWKPVQVTAKVETTLELKPAG